MSDARREQDDEPLTQLDVAIDTRNLDSLIEGDALTSPGTDAPRTDPDGADGEPQTMEPPRVMGVPRLRAPTIMGVAPPSSGANSEPSSQELVATPKRLNDNDDEQTTMVGKLLAEAHAEVAKRLKAEPKEEDLYSDETATTVGDAEQIIAAANEAALAKRGATEDEVDEPTESRSVRDAFTEDVTSKRDAINVDSALARAAELRAEAEARKKRAMKKRTIHGLGNGPLTLPNGPNAEDEVPTSESKLPDTGERPAASSRRSDKLVVPTPVPADGEMETLSGGAPQPAPMRSIHTEPETIQVPVPSTPRERLAAAPVNATLLAGHAPPPASPQGALQETLNLPPGISPYTQPMPYAPTVRMDESNGVDPLRATMQSPPGTPGPGHLPPPSPQLAMSPPGGVPHYHSTPMPAPAPQYSMQPHPNSGQAAFARTGGATRSEPLELPKKKSRAGLVFFFFLLLGLAGVGFWQRATLRAIYIGYRYPPPPAPPSAAPSAVPPASRATGPSTPPPVATDVPAAGGSSSAAPEASSSAAPHASASAAPSASASASASAKTPPKKPPPWRPPPPKPKPKATGGTAPKPLPVPKPVVDDSRGF